MSASSEERTAVLRKLIQAVAAQRQVPQDAVLLLDDDELGVLLKEKLTAEAVLQRTTYNELVEAGVSKGAAKVLKMMFPGPAEGAGGAAGVSGTDAAITITIYDPEEKPDLYDKTFKNAQQFENWMTRGNIADLFKGGKGPGTSEFSDLVVGATYTTAVRSIPARVRNLEQHKEHLVRRREHEVTLAVIDNLLEEGAQQAVEFEAGRVVKVDGKDVAEVDISVQFIDAHGQPGFVLGSAKTHVSGDSDVRNLEDKVRAHYEPRPPFLGHRIERAFMAELVQPGTDQRLKDTCKRLGVRLYGRSGRSIRRVLLSASMAAGGKMAFQ